MKTLVVACIQQKMRLPQTLEEYREDLRRFLRAAANKRARLVVFPELAGVMVIPPLLGGFQANLLKRADLGAAAAVKPVAEGQRRRLRRADRLVQHRLSPDDRRSANDAAADGLGRLRRRFRRTGARI